MAIVFERINRAGTELDVFELLSAWSWSDDFDLVEKFGDDYERYIKTVPRMNFVTGLFRLALRKQNRE